MRVFCKFFLARWTPLRENEGQVSKLRVFCVFGVPKSVLRIFQTTCFATYGRFFKKSKMSKIAKKLMVFGNFFMFKAILCGNPAVEC